MTIAVLSDIHFGQFSRTKDFSVPGEQTEEQTEGQISLLENLISLLKKENVDYIFVAGDLTSVGSPQEYFYCGEALSRIATEIGVANSNIIVGLGNHDFDRRISSLYESASASAADETLKALIRERYQLMAAHSAIHSIDSLSFATCESKIPCSGTIVRSDLVVFVLNSSWQCAHNQEYPHGKLSAKQLEWFKQEANKYVNDERTKIVLMHHHPVAYSYPTVTPDISMIEEGSELVDIAGRTGIDIIIHGHRHHPRAHTAIQSGWKHPITFICAGSLSVNAVHRNNGEIPNTVHILRTTDSTGTYQLMNFKYCESDGWQPVTYSKEVPLDGEMLLGKVFTQKQQEDALLAIVSANKEQTHQELHWNDLDESLRFMRLDELNDPLVSKQDSMNYKLFGRFPDEVMLSTK